MTEQQARRYLEDSLPMRFYPRENNLWLCPRCGMNLYLTESIYPALSRRAHVNICPPCGTNEAVEDYSGNCKPLSSWYAVKLEGQAPRYVDKTGSHISAGMRLLSDSGRICSVIEYEWLDGTPDLFFSSDGPLSSYCVKSQTGGYGFHWLLKWQIIPDAKEEEPRFADRGGR